ncbi:MAG TPA: gamma-glutamylcyclotransferase family protein [Gemmatimonadales bacterium]|nr:gamma-glutamylcyclotransferase family protein [Gemmatimonadales bacterium]
MFFYGLFMDPELLQDRGILPTDIRVASVSGFALRIGARATLVPNLGGQVHGVLMKLSHADLERLYADPSVRAYRPEAVLAVTRDGVTVAAMCYNLAEVPSPRERNAEYASKLRSLAQAIGLPESYVASIS